MINSLYHGINSTEKYYNPKSLIEKACIYWYYLRVDLILIKDGIVSFFVLFKTLIFGFSSSLFIIYNALLYVLYLSKRLGIDSGLDSLSLNFKCSS